MSFFSLLQRYWFRCLMALCQWLLFFFTSLFIARVIQASEGDADPLYRDCVEHCKKTGCVGNHCNQNCDFTTNGNFSGSLGYLQEPLYLKWKQWDCNSDCRYKCMIAREEERKNHGEKPIKYNGKWAFRRVYGFEEPVSVALSALNLAIQFHGWISFFILVHYNLPLKHKRKTYYEYTTLWHIHAILAMNSWFWSAVYHGRDLDLTQKLDYSSAAALIGYGLILSIFRAFSIKEEASRVIVAAPLIAFVTTHILFINFYYLDYGMNLTVCVIMGSAQLLLWAVWATVTRHPSCWKLWVVAFGGAISMLLQINDFPPYKGFIGAHAIWHGMTIPLTYLWWSFVMDDAEITTSNLMKKTKSNRTKKTK